MTIVYKVQGYSLTTSNLTTVLTIALDDASIVNTVVSVDVVKLYPFTL